MNEFLTTKCLYMYAKYSKTIQILLVNIFHYRTKATIFESPKFVRLSDCIKLSTTRSYLTFSRFIVRIILFLTEIKTKLLIKLHLFQKVIFHVFSSSSKKEINLS